MKQLLECKPTHAGPAECSVTPRHNSVSWKAGPSRREGSGMGESQLFGLSQHEQSFLQPLLWPTVIAPGLHDSLQGQHVIPPRGTACLPSPQPDPLAASHVSLFCIPAVHSTISVGQLTHEVIHCDFRAEKDNLRCTAGCPSDG